jgi:hypothetical protein
VEYKAVALAALLVAATEGISPQLLVDPKGISVSKISRVADQLVSAVVGTDNYDK